MERSHAVFLSLQDRPPRPIAAPERAVLCLGNFDGVHVAHRALLRAGVRSARAGGCLCGVFCFYRPSSDYFPALPAPEAAYASGTHLCSLSEKLARFAEEGVDFVWLCSFSAVRDIPAGISRSFCAPSVAVRAWSAALTTGMEQTVRELPQCLPPLSRVHRMCRLLSCRKCDWQTGRSAPHASVRRSGRGIPALQPHCPDALTRWRVA